MSLCGIASFLGQTQVIELLFACTVVLPVNTYVHSSTYSIKRTGDAQNLAKIKSSFTNKSILLNEMRDICSSPLNRNLQSVPCVLPLNMFQCCVLRDVTSPFTMLVLILYLNSIPQFQLWIVSLFFCSKMFHYVARTPFKKK